MSWATALFSSLLLREPGVREYGHAMSWASVLELALEGAGRSGVQACDELGHRNVVLSVLVQICT